MPRITVELSLAQYAQLSRLNAAINRRSQELGHQHTSIPIEHTAASALDVGLDRMGRVWYRTELAGGNPAQGPMQPCAWCGRSPAYVRAEDGKPECMRGDCPRPTRPVHADAQDDLYPLTAEAQS